MARREADQPKPWFIENLNTLDEELLCDICRHIDFNILFQNPHRAEFARIKLGLLRDIIMKDSCACCRLVVRAISVTYRIDLIKELKNEAKHIVCELMNEAKQTSGEKRVYVLDVGIFVEVGTILTEDYRPVTIHCLADGKNSKTNGRSACFQE